MPESNPHGAELSVDLAALAANWRELSKIAGGAECAAAVKADAYGTGAEAVIPALAAAGCRTFFTAHLTEALQARRLAPTARVFVLNGLPTGAAKAFVDAGIRPVLGSMTEIEEWAAATRGAAPCAIHVDTGMNRLGLTLDEARGLAARHDLLAMSGAELVISHMACADEPGHPLNEQQFRAFLEVKKTFPDLRASLANSSATMFGPEWHFDLVRPGIAIYGGSTVSGKPSPMRPVVKLSARIAQVRDGKAGQTVGYGATYTLTRDSRIAILSLGYADGYHRLASVGQHTPVARVHLHGRHAPLIGRISMDLSAVDVTDVPEAARGDLVELIGPNVPLYEVGNALGTIDYEVLTSLGRRYNITYTR